MARHRRDNCMRCTEPPTQEILWAEGRAHAWFCDAHLTEWDKENPLEINKQKAVVGGEVSKRWEEN